MHTILLVIGNIIDKIDPLKNNSYSECTFLLCTASLLLEEIANKPSIQGKYCPYVLSSAVKVLRFINTTPLPKSMSENKMSMLDLFIHDKLDCTTVKAFVNTAALLMKSLDKFYWRSEYRDYVLDFDEIFSIVDSIKFNKYVVDSLQPIISEAPVVKSILQLQKVQVASIKTFKPAKEIDNKEEREERMLKKEVKKAMRDAKRELKKDSEMIQKIRMEEVRIWKFMYMNT